MHPNYFTPERDIAAKKQHPPIVIYRKQRQHCVILPVLSTQQKAHPAPVLTKEEEEVCNQATD